jgi:hypothetical protein
MKFVCFRPKIVVDSFTEGVIRRNILQAYSNKEYLTTKKLHYRLLEDPNFPKMSVSTLWKVMRMQLGFKFLKFHNKPVPFERDDISAARHNYLRSIRNYRTQGYQVNYNFL